MKLGGMERMRLNLMLNLVAGEKGKSKSKDICGDLDPDDMSVSFASTLCTYVCHVLDQTPPSSHVYVELMIF